MRVNLRFAWDKERQARIGAAFRTAILAAGDEIVDRCDADVEIIHGVPSLSKINPRAQYVYIDKSYTRNNNRIRVALNCHNPWADAHMKTWPHDRRLGLGWHPAEWCDRPGGVILIAGSSEKFHVQHGLPHPTLYASRLIEEIRQHSSRTIVYRPKPSWRDAVPIDGALFSGDRRKTLASDLKRAHCMVTYGSNASFEALLAGVPQIVLGTAVARLVSCTQIDRVERPFRAPVSDVLNLLNGLAYHDWALTEVADGRAWSHIRRRLTNG